MTPDNHPKVGIDHASAVARRTGALGIGAEQRGVYAVGLRERLADRLQQTGVSVPLACNPSTVRSNTTSPPAVLAPAPGSTTWSEIAITSGLCSTRVSVAAAALQPTTHGFRVGPVLGWKTSLQVSFFSGDDHEGHECNRSNQREEQRKRVYQEGDTELKK